MLDYRLFVLPKRGNFTDNSIKEFKLGSAERTPEEGILNTSDTEVIKFNIGAAVREGDEVHRKLAFSAEQGMQKAERNEYDPRAQEKIH